MGFIYLFTYFYGPYSVVGIETLQNEVNSSVKILLWRGFERENSDR